jgi:(p)ppGpp synthase/HD superfamily hydrolase
MLLKLPSTQTALIIACLIHDIGEDTTYFGGMKPGARGFETLVRDKLHMVLKDFLELDLVDSVVDTFLAVTRKKVTGSGTTMDKAEARGDAHKRAKANAGAALIKLVDRLHNTATIDVRRPEKILKTAKETKEQFLHWPKNAKRDYHILAASLEH